MNRNQIRKAIREGLKPLRINLNTAYIDWTLFAWSTVWCSDWDCYWAGRLKGSPQLFIYRIPPDTFATLRDLFDGKGTRRPAYADLSYSQRTAKPKRKSWCRAA